MVFFMSCPFLTFEFFVGCNWVLSRFAGFLNEKAMFACTKHDAVLSSCEFIMCFTCEITTCVCLN